MDDDRPLFSTFKPIGEDNRTSAKPGPDTTPVQPQGAEQPPGHHDTDGRVGRGAVKGDGVAPSASPPLGCKIGSWTPGSHEGGEGEQLWAPSRRETEQLLQDQPPGCFLVRFSESTVGFVLSYR
ncbi:SH2 domain-containing protein 2A, partial [Pygoscelis antarcticus]